MRNLRQLLRDLRQNREVRPSYNWPHVIERLAKRAQPRPYKTPKERRTAQGISPERQRWLQERAAARRLRKVMPV